MVTWAEMATLAVQIMVMCVQIATAIIIFVGILLALRQLKATLAASQASNFFDLVAYLQREEVREARHRVHGLAGYEEWRADEKSREAAQQVGSSYDIAAVAMSSGLINPRVFAEPWRTSICSTYDVIKDYIRERQESTGDHMYLAHYVGLAKWLKREPPYENEPYGVPFHGKHR